MRIHPGHEPDILSAARKDLIDWGVMLLVAIALLAALLLHPIFSLLKLASLALDAALTWSANQIARLVAGVGR